MNFSRLLHTNSRLWPCLQLAVLSLATVYLHREVVGGFGDRVWYISADSWKNVYTFVYHALHDEQAWQTMALHWPYGDHVTMADAQPFISNVCRPLVQLGILDERSLTYLVLMLPLLSIPLLGLMLYQLERAFGLSRSWAAAWALPLTLLYPQLLRVQGHYALAYGWVFPLLILLWLRLRRGGYRATDSVLVALVLTPAALTHPYYLGIGGALVLALVLIDWAAHREHVWWRYGRALALGMLLPAVIFFTISRLGDQPTDRVVTPYGFAAFRSKPQALVSDIRLPHWRAFNDHVKPLKLPSEEGYAYLGLLPAVGILWFGLSALGRRLRRRESGWLEVQALARRREWTVVALAGLALAIYSWGFPMASKGALFDQVRALAGPLKQMRGLGRFAWGTYYLWAPLGAALLTLTTPAHVNWRRLLLVLGLAFAVWEGASIWSARRFEGMQHTLMPSRSRIVEAVQGIKPAAIIPVPFYHVGSENFSLDDGYYSIYFSTYPSLVLGVPGAGLYMSRTSWSQSLLSAELANPWTAVPTELFTEAGDATYLVAVSKLYLDDQPAMMKAYQPLFDNATLLLDDEFLQLYRVREQDLPLIARQRRAALLAEAAASSAPDLYTVLDFNDLPNERGLDGSGGLVITDEPSIAVATLPLSPAVGGDTLALSYLLKLEDGGQVEAVLIANFLDLQGNSLGAVEVVTSNVWRQVLDSWVSVLQETVVPAGATHLQLSLRPGQRMLSVGGVLDQVVLRRARVGFVLPQGAYTVVNGWLMPSQDAPAAASQ